MHVAKPGGEAPVSKNEEHPRHRKDRENISGSELMVHRIIAFLRVQIPPNEFGNFP